MTVCNIFFFFYLVLDFFFFNFAAMYILRGHQRSVRPMKPLLSPSHTDGGQKVPELHSSHLIRLVH